MSALDRSARTSCAGGVESTKKRSRAQPVPGAMHRI